LQAVHSSELPIIHSPACPFRGEQPRRAFRHGPPSGGSIDEHYFFLPDPKVGCHPAVFWLGAAAIVLIFSFLGFFDSRFPFCSPLAMSVSQLFKKFGFENSGSFELNLTWMGDAREFAEAPVRHQAPSLPLDERCGSDQYSQKQKHQQGWYEPFGQIEFTTIRHSTALWIEAGARRSQSPITATIRAAIYPCRRFQDK
jgi:hypothetical protein